MDGRTMIEKPKYAFRGDKADPYICIVVDIPGLQSRRTRSIRFKGVRPKFRKAAQNADILFAAGERACTLDVSLRRGDPAAKTKYELQLHDLPNSVKPPPHSFYEIHESSITLYLRKNRG